MTTQVSRAELATALGNNAKVVKYFEERATALDATTAIVTTNVEATTALNQAAVLVLGANAAFENERVLAVTGGLGLKDEGPGKRLILSYSSGITAQGGFRLTFNLAADTVVNLPVAGTLATTDLGGITYADDAAAAAAGVAIGELYRAPLGIVSWRQI